MGEDDGAITQRVNANINIVIGVITNATALAM